MILPARGADLLVAAAADLSPLEKPLAVAAATRLGLPVRFSFGSSGNLARQISQGAPFDVFLSADQQFIATGLTEGWLAKGTDQAYASGRIALWSASGSIKDLGQLADRTIRHIAIANPKFAPYGRAGKQALERSGLWPKVEDRIVYGENIRQTLIYIETGNAEAGIVSWSLVQGRGGVLLAATLHDPIRQTGAVVQSSARREDGRRFLNFLLSAEGQQILQAHGLFRP